ncbi:hypothetical protein A2837_03370 [Candidatus Kaiserbacteria bacterium RIFCSPHIGHO2_01_FULL_46_22]|uniref:Nudix hydrolase domain-containing protein n=1 Tax=Candidatus Kaiserbacteria bacterium RIFCSPHIGHO2_01_FULL_46_22 TaxID=1798475 RepID=A0A1F6BX37_9BACT|nr:MAG: hypothetical protein A2837_03370 [Candidatus Kaiserbacteria bacterium RIFCSPHIGHO2_01_FULL_46_22]
MKTRQVVAVILLAPDGKRLCLIMPEAAKEDGKLNLSSPQGEIEDYESIWSAASRHLYNELGVDMCGPVVYLGSSHRRLPTDHHRAQQYRHYRYHWVSAYASGHTLHPKVQLAKANWYDIGAVDYLSKCMSDQKGAMFKGAVTTLQKKVSNNHLIRKSILENDPDRLLGTDTMQAVA